RTRISFGTRGVTALPSGAPSAGPQRHEDAVADRQDRRHEFLVREDGLVVLADRGDPLGPSLARGDVPAPPAERVVADVHASGADAGASFTPRIRVAVLVDVAVDRVPLAADLAQRGHGVSDVEGDRVDDAGPPQVVERLPLVLGGRVGEVDHDMRTGGSDESRRGIAVTRAWL